MAPMGAGICGWIHDGEGPPGEGSPSLRLDALAGALSHRGAIAVLPRDGSAEARTEIAADSAFNTTGGILQAWEASQGDPRDFASRLRGSFAVALLDPRRRLLVLARDRLGEKPLVYRSGPEGIAFASEMKALRAAGLAGGGDLRPEAVDAFFAFTYIPAPWTIHREIMKVPAGHVARFELGGGPPSPKVERYWTLPPREDLDATPGEALERLAAAVERRAPEGEAAAAFLSGGLDSSLVVALLARGGRRKVSTFSAGFAEAGLDESAHARRVAGLMGTRHREIILREVDEDLVLRAVRHLDEPMSDAAVLPTLVLAEAASRVSPVAMTGDGADALMAGDHWFRRLRLMDGLERVPAAGRRALAAVASLGGGRSASRLRMHTELAAHPPALRYLRIREKWSPARRRALYAGGYRRGMDASLAGETYLRAPVEWRRGASVDAAVRLDTLHGLPEGLLMKVDKMGMAHGLECRSPFLDTEWVEWISRLRVDLLLKCGSGKHILRRAARRVLPRDLIQRRKQGFRVPMSRWLKGPLRELLEGAFSPDLVRSQGLFDPDTLSGLKARFEAGDPPPDPLAGWVWQVVAFQAWWRTGRC